MNLKMKTFFSRKRSPPAITKSATCSKAQDKYNITLKSNGKDADTLFQKLREKSIELITTEPYLTNLLESTILHPKSISFNAAISRVVASRLHSSCGENPLMCVHSLTNIIQDAMESTDLEYGHTMTDAIVEDILASYRRDPASETELEVVLFYKGFAALVCHRAARRHYISKPNNGGHHKRFVSLWLQSQASAAFGVDIHPAAEIGAGVFFDHASGLVIGETAKVGNHCTILHGVTLGGTGKDTGDRHPKVGDHVLIGAGTSILGNIKIGNRAKIGAGSIVLKPIPHGATAVGAPAKIIGWARESRPGSSVDMSLSNISTLGDDEESDESDPIFSHIVEESDEQDESENNDKDIILDKEEQKDTSVIAQDDRRRMNVEFCVFRSMSRCKEGQISYKNLFAALKSCCSEDEIGEVYMELLKIGKKSHVTKQAIAEYFESISQKYTHMNNEECKRAQNMLLQR